MDSYDEEEAATCANLLTTGICGSNRRVAWSPLLGGHICEPCRLTRTDQLLKEPVTALPVTP